MLSKYTNLFFPICSLTVVITILIIFVCKKRINTAETKLYFRLIMTSFFEALLYTTICLLAHIANINKYYILYAILNKTLYAIYIIWFTILFKYIMTIYIENREKTILKSISNALLCIFDIIIITLIFALEVKIFYDPISGLSNSYGPSANVLLIGSEIYILSMTIMSIFDLKRKRTTKYIPFYLLLILMMAVLIIRLVDPLFSIYSNALSLTILVMYFTIENPDVKLLNELHKAKEISDNASEEKTLFLYNMTQEIRSIANKIDTEADEILDSKDLEIIYDKTRDIKANASKFTTMTNDILDISQVDFTNIKTYNSKYNIKNILKLIVNIYTDSCKNKQLEFRTNIDHDVPEILYGDGIGLKEVLTTILNNSVKYTEKGFIELDVNTIIKNDACRLIITIEDSGTGLKSEEINNIDNEDNSLSKAKKLITIMNGAMLISSDYGIGTKIKIILDQKIKIIENKATRKYDQFLNNIKVLLVDDTIAGLKIMEKVAKKTNINLDIATNGKECIDKIKTNKYDLILLDEKLSNISAKEIIVKIKEIKKFNTPVALLTNDNSYEYNDEYLKQGFVGYILKPIKKDTIVESINRIINKE